MLVLEWRVWIQRRLGLTCLGGYGADNGYGIWESLGKTRPASSKLRSESHWQPLPADSELPDSVPMERWKMTLDWIPPPYILHL